MFIWCITENFSIKALNFLILLYVVLLYSKFQQRKAYFFKSQAALDSYLKGAYGNLKVRFFIGYNAKGPSLNLQENRTS